MRSKSDIKRANYDFSIRDMLNNKDKAIEEELAKAEKEKEKALYESANTLYAIHRYNEKQKQALAERKLGYMDHFLEVAISEALSYVAHNALLLNTDEYAKLNENYSKEIDDTIRGFVENNQIDTSFKNETLLELYNAIQKDLPVAELYLTEEQEHAFVKDLIASVPKIKNGLEQMTRDVRARVANIVAKDQEALAKENDDLDYIDQKELSKAPVLPVQQTMDQEVTPLADPEDPNSVVTAQEPEPVEEIPAEQSPASVKESLHIIRKNNNIGIVEALSLNEAKTMIDEGKELNNTLALANTIKLITIFETVDESGIVRFGPEEYNRIVSATGKNMNPVAKTDLPGEQLAHAPVANEIHDHEEAKVEGVEKPELNKSSKDKKVEKEIDSLKSMTDSNDSGIADIDIFSGIGSSISQSSMSIFSPLADWEKNHPSTEEIVDIPESYRGKYVNHRGEAYTEKELREYFTNEGFDLNYVDFDSLVSSYNFVKH